MNWLGKVFVVLILIMSLLFLGLTLAVYATHKNWKEVVDGPNGLKSQLANAETENQQLKAQHMRRVEALEAEKSASEQQVVKLETERVSLADRNVAIQTELDQQKQDQRQHIAAVAATQENNQKLTTEVISLRDQIRKAEQDRDTLFGKTLEATEKLHQLNGQYESAVERLRQLTQQVSGMTHIIEAHGLDSKADPTSVAPTVDGVVKQIRRTGGAQFVEVSIGADDGLKAGNTLEVFRGSKYLGRVDIVSTSPDKSVGKVDRRFQQGQIQEGDSVATRLQF
jgi:signal transduction histidine kinase